MSTGSSVLEKAKSKVDPLEGFSRKINLSLNDLSLIWSMTESGHSKLNGAQIDAFAALRAKIKPAIEEIKKLLPPAK